MQFDDNFTAAAPFMSFDINGDGTVSNVEWLPLNDTSSTQIHFTAGTNSFEADFLAAALTYSNLFSVVNEAESTENFRVYESGPGTPPEERFVLLIPGSPLHGQSYVTLASWNSASADPDRDITFGTILFGKHPSVQPGVTKMTGTANYNGLTLGHLVENNIFYTLSGSVQITFTFSNSEFTGSLFDMLKTNPDTGVESPWSNVSMTGSLNENLQFLGNSSIAGTSNSGTVSGSFYGPITDGQSPEMSGVWSVTGIDMIAVGAFIGRK